MENTHELLRLDKSLNKKIMKSKAVFFKLYEENPEQKKIDKILDILRNDGVIIYPTDTVYAFGCSIMSRSAIDRLARLKGMKPGKERFSLIFYCLSQISEYAKNIHTPIFKVMKKQPMPLFEILRLSAKPLVVCRKISPISIQRSNGLK